MKTPLLLCTSAMLITGLVCLPSCSKKKAPDTAEEQSKPEATGPKYTVVTDAPETERQELEAFGKQLQEDLRTPNLEAVKGAFDVPGIVALITAGVTTNSSKVTEFKTGLGEGMRGNLDFMAKTWADPDATFKHLVVHDGKLKLRFRIASDATGITILDLLVKKRANGKLGIVDFYNQNLGTGIVDQGRQAAGLALAEMDKGFLQRVMGTATVTLKDFEKFASMSEKFRNQDFKGAAATYEQLPPVLKSNMAAVATRINALQQSGDDEAYKKALKEAAGTFKSANFQFMLVDLYFLEKDYTKAIESLEVFMAAVERDAALLALRSGLELANGTTEKAVATAKEALTLEPRCVYAHSHCLDVFLAAKDYATLVKSMHCLEEKGAYKFKGHLKDDVWAEFLKAPESEPWR